MTTILYPTPDQLQLVVRWSSQGPGVLDPDNGMPDRTARNSEKNKARVSNLARLRDLIFRLNLPYQYETMRTEILYRPVTGIDTRLLAQLIPSLRLYGYVHESGPVPDGGTAPLYAVTPLTAYQLHILRLYAAGQSPGEIAEFFGVTPSRITYRMRVARRSLGLESDGMGQLMAYVYACGWLPTFREQRTLMESEHKPVGRPYRVVSGWVSHEKTVSA